MRFLADECCDRLLVAALRAAGHDIRYAAENDRGASDDLILAAARADSDLWRIPRVLLVIANSESRLRGSYTVIQAERVRFRSLE